ncbi:MAG: hypothetical protein A2888_01955 [Chlamydiae bacterium RIFCSPLOWO2_01_FULL_28_7]|nr:MAG: hypothetical protein A2888_01955 [Chlamydiae bacterium RIFCSPLOWO2_01_FULL_28_7]
MTISEIKKTTSSVTGSDYSFAARLFYKTLYKIEAVVDECFSDTPSSAKKAALSAELLQDKKTEMKKQREALEFLLTQKAEINEDLFPEIQKSLKPLSGKLLKKDLLIPVMTLAYALAKQKIDFFITFLSKKPTLDQKCVKSLKKNKLIKLVVFNIFLKVLFETIFNNKLSQDDLISLYGDTETSKIASLIYGKDISKIEDSFKINNYSIIFETDRLFEGTYLQKGKSKELQTTLDRFISARSQKDPAIK